jgi:hypothetical protein
VAVMEGGCSQIELNLRYIHSNGVEYKHARRKNQAIRESEILFLYFGRSSYLKSIIYFIIIYFGTK